MVLHQQNVQSSTPTDLALLTVFVVDRLASKRAGESQQVSNVFVLGGTWEAWRGGYCCEYNFGSFRFTRPEQQYSTLLLYPVPR